MPKSIHIPILIAAILLCTSCSQKFYYQDAFIANDIPEFRTKVSNDVLIQTRFAGDAFNYLVFELDIENTSDQDITISIDDIRMQIIDSDYTDNVTLAPLNKEDLIEELKQEHNNIRKERKVQNTVGIIGAGLTILSLAIAPGGDALNTIAYAADVSSIIIEDNRSYALIQGDIESQIVYIDEWVLEDATIPSGTKTSYDLILPSTLINGDGSLIIKNKNIDYAQEYIFEIVEAKM